jgi:hypothetical protein
MHNTDEAQSKLAETLLLDALKHICLDVDIQLADWEVNKKLYLAIIKNSKYRSHSKSFETYTTTWNVIKALKIKIPAKYKWFTNLDLV